MFLAQKNSSSANIGKYNPVPELQFNKSCMEVAEGEA
jgi:hypothetical protein